MTQTAKVYGNALFELACEEAQTEEFLSQVLLLRKLLRENPDLLRLLDCRSVSLEQRKKVVEDCFSSFLPELRSFAKLLCDKNSVCQLPDCLRQFVLRYNSLRGIAEVTVISAVPLEERQKEKLLQTLEGRTGKAVHPRYVTDPAVLGGIRLQLDGEELDGTLRRRLDTLAKELHQLTL